MAKYLTHEQIKRLPDIAKLEILTSRLSKMVPLMRHYGIDPKDGDNAFFVLACRLASEFVPGFKVLAPKRKPRSKK